MFICIKPKLLQDRKFYKLKVHKEFMPSCYNGVWEGIVWVSTESSKYWHSKKKFETWSKYPKQLTYSSYVDLFVQLPIHHKPPFNLTHYRKNNKQRQKRRERQDKEPWHAQRLVISLHQLSLLNSKRNPKSITHDKKWTL